MIPWWYLIIAAMVGGTVSIIIFALCIASKNPCHDCEVFNNPDSDYRNCVDCKKVKN